MKQNKATFPFYKGTLVIIGDQHEVTDIYYTHESLDEVDGKEEVLKAKQQFLEYCEGKRRVFDFSLSIEGTIFQQAIYKALKDISFGETLSYKQLAECAGYPKAARAVGQAMANNRLLLVVPCHRVIASNGDLGGFTGGLDLKQYLLNHEKGQ